jgi:outer membrane biosynthesis protein TonB
MKALISILLFILIASLPSPLKSSSDVAMYYATENTTDSSNVMNDKEWVISRFIPQEEEYIDDIPWDTKQVIASRFKYPEPARKENEEGSVLITFSYNENGYIEVKTAISDNEKLKDYVVKTLQSIKLTQGIVDLSKEYTARFDFRLL